MLQRLESDRNARRETLVRAARDAAANPIYRRAHSLSEVGQNRTWLDGRAEALEPEIKEQFALAMSDFAACRGLADELPLLAAAYRLTNDAALLERITAQLDEMAGGRRYNALAGPCTRREIGFRKTARTAIGLRRGLACARLGTRSNCSRGALSRTGPGNCTNC